MKTVSAARPVRRLLSLAVAPLVSMPLMVWAAAAAAGAVLIVLSDHLHHAPTNLSLLASLNLVSRIRLRPSRARLFGYPADHVTSSMPGGKGLIGQRAVVLSFDIVAREGRVTFGGREWPVESGDALMTGDLVRIDGRTGAKLFVQKLHALTQS